MFLEQQYGKEHFVEYPALRRKYRSRRERVSGGYKQCVHLSKSFNVGVQL